ncbi:hypothetical protein PR003_g12478 [Phytophthora rubi]|uniref:BED-type domain-containing protein n=1 Tax=Phytophthora rubi TaxID=129364 RepID=A0A6A3N8T0_9STRA|nr:hypothetical protein PR001_g8670 [Phytophthora rubi]KAE9336499.1 hypothetical protein PR003_g12478 [Phytophthora rubi]
MIIPSRIIYQAWFKPDVADQRYHHCICGKVYQQDVTISGYSNLLQHLKAAHKGYEAITNVKGTLQPAITELLQLGKSASLNKGANWIVMKALPLSFCEDPHTRVTAHAKGPHARDHEEGVHYVGLVAVFPPTDANPAGRVLLAFSPLEDESDHGAQSLSNSLADTLSEFERPWSCVLFVVGDNCSVNQYLGDRGGIPFIGWASHRYNLAVQLFQEDYSDLVTKANKLMLKLSTVKGRACLDSVTGVHPKIKNETRWSSTMKMLKRWNDLIPALRQMSTKNAVKCGVDKLMLSATEAMELSKLVKDLTKLDSVTIALQDEELTMLQVRDRFDHTIAKYPITKKYLSANAAIINNAPFERALVKLQSGRKLTPVEREASARLLAPAVEETSLRVSLRRRSRSRRSSAAV